MPNIRSSYYSRRDKVVASLDLATRMLERWSADPVMTHLAERLRTQAQRMADGYGGLDTQAQTEEVRSADESRDNAARALQYHLKALLASEAHRNTWEAAAQLISVVAGNGMGWIHDSYNTETLKVLDVMGKMEGMGTEIETCQAQVYVDQLKTAQESFERKVVDRGNLMTEKPEIVARIIPDFEHALRSTLMLLEGRDDDADRQYVLEPFTRLKKVGSPSPQAPAPTPEA